MPDRQAPIALRGLAIPAVFAAIALLLALLGIASVQLLVGVRSYVSGEAYYSKGQKNAVRHLLEFIDSGEPQRFARYESAIAVPLGDRRARLALDRPDPDLDEAFRGFLQGGNHADDIAPEIRVFRMSRGVLPLFDQAVAIWARGDELVARLDALAQAARAERGAGPLAPARQAELRQRVLAIDDELAVLEDAFTAKIGEVARLTQRVLVSTMVLLAAGLTLPAIAFARRSWRALERSERELAESGARLELAAAAGDIGVYDGDLRAGRVRLDTRGRRLFGLEDEAGDGEAAGVPIARVRERVHPDDEAPLRQRLDAAIAERRAIETRFRVVRPSGEVRTLELSARAHAAERRMVGFLWDVSNDLLTETLRMERNAAARASEAKSEFLSRVSHELRTPLNAVIGFTQLMLTDRADPPSPGQKLRLQRVEQGGQMLLKLVDDLLAITRIEQGRLGVQLADLDLRPVLESSIALLEPARAARGVSLVADLPARLLVHADGARLGQVFANLLSNAVKYNRPEGRITVRAGVQGAQAVVEVADTGFGLTPEQRAQLFQPFNRLGAEYSSIDGTGLGLVISRKLVESLGGTLEFTSDPPRGSRVFVRLPLAAAPAPAKSPAQHESA